MTPFRIRLRSAHRTAAAPARRRSRAHLLRRPRHDARPRIDPRTFASSTPRPPTADHAQDALTGEWVSVAAARQNRAFLPPATSIRSRRRRRRTRRRSPPTTTWPCSRTSRRRSAPSSLGERGRRTALDDLARIGLGRERASVGRCEVVCFSPEHEGSFGEPRRHPGAHRDRGVGRAHRTPCPGMPGVEQVFPFENRGEEIGVTLHHPHGQIYAYPFVTPRTQRLLDTLDALRPEPVRRHPRLRAGGPSASS